MGTTRAKRENSFLPARTTYCTIGRYDPYEPSQLQQGSAVVAAMQTYRSVQFNLKRGQGFSLFCSLIQRWQHTSRGEIIIFSLFHLFLVLPEIPPALERRFSLDSLIPIVLNKLLLDPSVRPSVRSSFRPTISPSVSSTGRVGPRRLTDRPSDRESVIQERLVMEFPDYLFLESESESELSILRMSPTKIVQRTPRE